MTKKNAAKLAARARQQKHGGKYLHHLRIVTGGPHGPFERLVHRVIGLTQARNEEEDSRSISKGSRFASHDIGGIAKRIFEELDEPLKPAQAAWLEALRALSYRDLRKLHVLMYAGRENDDVLATGRVLRPEGHDATVGIVDAKVLLLAEYLTDGLRLAKEQGLDLEADFG